MHVACEIWMLASLQGLASVQCLNEQSPLESETFYETVISFHLLNKNIVYFPIGLYGIYQHWTCDLSRGLPKWKWTHWSARVYIGSCIIAVSVQAPHLLVHL